MTGTQQSEAKATHSSAPCATAIVTGAAAGIGRAVVAALSAVGVRIAAIDRDADGLAAIQLANVHPVVVDLLDPTAAESAVAEAWAALGSIEGVVNCAGIYPVTPLMDLPVAEWDQVLNLNLRAPFLIGRAAARKMIEQQITGRIVNISSTAATFCRPGIAHYGSSKAGLNQLTRDMAIELAPPRHSGQCSGARLGGNRNCNCRRRAGWPGRARGKTRENSPRAGRPDGRHCAADTHALVGGV